MEIQPCVDFYGIPEILRNTPFSKPSQIYMPSCTRRFVIRAALLVAVTTGILFIRPQPAFSQLTPAVAAGQMGRGINLGNTLEPPTEGSWNNGLAQEYYFDEYVAAGFCTVRIPVRWDLHTSNTAPFTITASWMNRVEQIVEWALQRDLFVIINAHHEDWLKQGYANATLRSRFDRIWEQIATRFQNKSEKLLFEIINEPNGMTRVEVDDLNARILGIIRQTNPTRIVIYSGNEYSNVDQLLAAAIPDDPYIMAYFHSYDPWNFAGLGTGIWGSASDRYVLRQRIGRVATWSANSGVPVMVSEFGAVYQTDYNSRMRYFSAYVEELISVGMPFQVWDDGGSFEVMKRAQRDWHETKDILINTYPDGPTNFNVSTSGSATALLTWENRAPQNSIVIERALPGTGFEPVAVLSSSATSYTDEDVQSGISYRYRVVGKNALMGDRHSHPLSITLAETRSGFLGAPQAIPGTIEAENFDNGGEGIAYHDGDSFNTPGKYRQDVGVDIETHTGGGYQIGYVEAGEWLEYTVDVQAAGVYRLTAEVASLSGGGRVVFSVGSATSSRLLIPATGGWQATAPLETPLSLAAGVQILRVDIYSVPEYNVDRMVFEYLGTTAVEQPEREALASNLITVYPNPAHGHVAVKTDSSIGPAELSVYNVLGRSVLMESITNSAQVLDVSELPAGWYMVVVRTDGHTVGSAPFISR